MCVFTHFAAGALVGTFWPNVFAAPFAGLGSHIILDMIPHRDFENMKLEIFLWLAAFAILLAGGVYRAPVIVAGLFAVLPDLENLLWKTGRIAEGSKIFPGHTGGWIRHGREAGIYSIYIQVLFTVAAIIVVFWRNR